MLLWHWYKALLGPPAFRGKDQQTCLTGSLLKALLALEDDSEDLDAFVTLDERDDIQFTEESLKCSWDICMQEVLTVIYSKGSEGPKFRGGGKPSM